MKDEWSIRKPACLKKVVVEEELTRKIFYVEIPRNYFYCFYFFFTAEKVFACSLQSEKLKGVGELNIFF